MRKLFTFLFAALMSVGMFAQLATPVISGDEEFTESTTITITCASAGVDISYSLDGSNPGNGYLYTGPITITETTTVKAQAFNEDGEMSAVAEKTFTKKAGASATTVVTITDSDFPMSGQSFTKDGVTVSAGMIDSDEGNLMAGGSFSTTLGNFTKIEVSAMDVNISGEGWSGNSQKMTWTGNASSISFSGEIMGMGMGTTLKFTIEEPAPTTYTLQLVADPEKGSVAVTNLLGSGIVDNGNGNYTVPANAEVTILATPLEGFEFTGWKVGNIEEMVGCYYCGTALNTNDNPYTFTMTADVAYLAEFEAEPEVQGVVTLILANLPEENRPATIELAGTFDEGTAELEKLDTGWFIYNFIHASADATGKFRDKTNPNMVLCEFIPANGDEEGKWVQAIFKISDYGYWDEDGWKGTACMWTEIDVTGEQYAWMEGMPEPLPEPTGFENIVLTEKAKKVIVDGVIYIVRDGKLFNLTGAQVR